MMRMIVVYIVKLLNYIRISLKYMRSDKFNISQMVVWICNCKLPYFKLITSSKVLSVEKLRWKNQYSSILFQKWIMVVNNYDYCIGVIIYNMPHCDNNLKTLHSRSYFPCLFILINKYHLLSLILCWRCS